MPFHVTAFDGSSAGPEDADVHLDITSPDALAYIVTAPGDLGLARAYIPGGLQICGEHPGHPIAVFDHLQHLYDQALQTWRLETRASFSDGLEARPWSAWVVRA